MAKCRHLFGLLVRESFLEGIQARHVKMVKDQSSLRPYESSEDRNTLLHQFSCMTIYQKKLKFLDVVFYYWKINVSYNFTNHLKHVLIGYIMWVNQVVRQRWNSWIN